MFINTNTSQFLTGAGFFFEAGLLMEENSLLPCAVHWGPQKVPSPGFCIWTLPAAFERCFSTKYPCLISSTQCLPGC